MAIGAAPLQKPFLAEDGASDRSWLNWFSDVGSSINGEWSISPRQLSASGVSSKPNTSWISYQGREVRYLFIWNSGVTFSAGAKLSLEKQDLTLIGGVLDIYEAEVLVGGAFAQNRTISLPELDLSGRIVIQGCILTKVRDPRDQGGR